MSQIISRIKWHLRIAGTHKLPKPMWFPPKDGWITDPKEIENAIRLDEDMGIKSPNKERGL